MSDYIDMRSELCKSCAHTKVCRKDKNLVGDVFVMGHPAFFDNNELFRKYKEREAVGFPCDDYMQERKHGKWMSNDLNTYLATGAHWYCSECGNGVVHPDQFCPNCGANMRGES